MKYEVAITKTGMKGIKKLPKKEALVLKNLLLDLESRGPVLPNYPNYSKLSDTTYHCHLSYHWVACWRNVRGHYIVEVYYVGSRESAPY